MTTASPYRPTKVTVHLNSIAQPITVVELSNSEHTAILSLQWDCTEDLSWNGDYRWIVEPRNSWEMDDLLTERAMEAAWPYLDAAILRASALIEEIASEEHRIQPTLDTPASA